MDSDFAAAAVEIATALMPVEKRKARTRMPSASRTVTGHLGEADGAEIELGAVRHGIPAC